MKALSIRAPWWWFILHAGKDIENRDWWTGYRGKVLVHASKWYSGFGIKSDWDDARVFANLDLAAAPPMTLRQFKDTGGHIVGSVEIVDCVTQSDSPWFQGKYGFVLRNPKAFDHPYPVKGALGFFDVGEREKVTR